MKRRRANTRAATNNGTRKRDSMIADLPPGTEQIVHFWHRALRLGGDTLCIMLVGINSPLPPICRCSKWRTTHSLRRGIHWACAVTSACTYSVASSARSSIDTTEHVLRPHTSTHEQTHTEADRHAYRIRNSSLLHVCAIINNSGIARLQTARSEYQTSGGAEGRRGGDWTGP